MNDLLSFYNRLKSGGTDILVNLGFSKETAEKLVDYGLPALLGAFFVSLVELTKNPEHRNVLLAFTLGSIAGVGFKFLFNLLGNELNESKEYIKNQLGDKKTTPTEVTEVKTPTDEKPSVDTQKTKPETSVSSEQPVQKEVAPVNPAATQINKREVQTTPPLQQNNILSPDQSNYKFIPPTPSNSALSDLSVPENQQSPHLSKSIDSTPDLHVPSTNLKSVDMLQPQPAPLTQNKIFSSPPSIKPPTLQNQEPGGTTKAPLIPNRIKEFGELRDVEDTKRSFEEFKQRLNDEYRNKLEKTREYLNSRASRRFQSPFVYDPISDTYIDEFSDNERELLNKKVPRIAPLPKNQTIMIYFVHGAVVNYKRYHNMFKELQSDLRKEGSDLIVYAQETDHLWTDVLERPVDTHAPESSERISAEPFLEAIQDFRKKTNKTNPDKLIIIGTAGIVDLYDKEKELVLPYNPHFIIVPGVIRYGFRNLGFNEENSKKYIDLFKQIRFGKDADKVKLNTYIASYGEVISQIEKILADKKQDEVNQGNEKQK